jgi:hypothetical protein
MFFLVFEFLSTLLFCNSHMCLFFSLQTFLCLLKMFFCNSTCVFPITHSNQIGGMDTIICVNDDELGCFGHVGGGCTGITTEFMHDTIEIVDPTT